MFGYIISLLPETKIYNKGKKNDPTQQQHIFDEKSKYERSTQMYIAFVEWRGNQISIFIKNKLEQFRLNVKLKRKNTKTQNKTKTQ